MKNSVHQMLALCLGILMFSSCSKLNMNVTKVAAISAPGFSISDVTGDEGHNLIFTVQLIPALSETATIDFSVSNGSALSGSHFTSSSGTLTFLPGEMIHTISILTIADPAELCALDRNFTIHLSNASGAEIVTSSGTGTIKDPDVPTISISNAIAVTEGSAASFTVSLSSACQSKNVSFNYATSGSSAVSGADYTAVNQSGLIPMGSISTILNVTTINDSVFETAETFTTSISSISNALPGTAAALGTINDNDTIPTVQFSATNQTFSEAGGTATITASLSNASYQNITVPFTLSGTAVEGALSDYTNTTSPVSVPAGALSTTISVVVMNDTINELDETIIATIGSPTNATKGVTDIHTITITDNDPAIVTQVTSAFANATYNFGAIDLQVAFTSNVDVMGTPLLNLNTTPARFASYVSGSGSSTLLFRYNIQALDSSADLDYISTSALVLAGGTIIDSLKGTNVNLTLSTPGAAGSLGFNKNIVINAYPAPSITSVSIPADGINYLGDALKFSINFNEAVNVVGAPYIALDIGGTIVNANYVSGTGTVNLLFRYIIGSNVNGDGPLLTSPVNLNGGFIRSSTSNFNATLGFTYPNTTGVLVDGRSIYLNFSNPNQVIDEASGLSKTFTITLNYPSLVSLTIPLTVQTGNVTAGADYQVSATSVVITAGQTSVTVGYDVFDDAISELRNYFSVTADRPASRTNLVLGKYPGSRVSIIDNDATTDRWLQVSTGYYFSCGITLGGVLKCWGSNFYGQIGDGTLIDRPLPVTIDAGVSYKYISAGQFTACGITSTNVLKCWGYNSYRQVGDGTNTNRTSPVIINAGISYKKVELDSYHTCGITTADVLHCWGSNAAGELGDGTLIDRSTPVIADTGVSYKDVTLGPEYTCGITNTDALKCWGANYYGQLGDGTDTDSLIPITVDPGVSYKKVTMGEYHTCGLTTMGAVKCWGANWSYQFGDGTDVDSFFPINVDAGVNYLSISAGDDMTCGVTDSNVMKCWGYGYLGDGYYEGASLPMIINPGASYKSVDLGRGLNCAISSSDILKCWGHNFIGELADGSRTQGVLPIVIDSGINYKMSSGGANQSCGITSSDDLKCWGYNSRGEIGDGTNLMRPIPVIIDPGEKYKIIAAGYFHTCGITTSDVLKCWGHNYYGQLGIGSTTNSFLPVVVDSGVTYKAIALGNNNTCGITSSDVLKCWGANSGGQVGDGTTTNILSPTVIDTGVSYKAISTNNITCGITGTDVLKCWGINSFGGVGDGTTIHRPLPVVINAGVNYKAISVSSLHACGITTANVLKCWGYGGGGSLGNGGANSFTPVTIDSGVSYKTVSTGGSGGCGITSSDVLKCWGVNSYGQVGDGTLTNRSTPVVSNAGISFKTIASGSSHVCGVTTTDMLRCWGDNGGGQIGNEIVRFPFPGGDF
jgi:alpha-tubulin suppressor-like RCC1 family protein